MIIFRVLKEGMVRIRHLVVLHLLNVQRLISVHLLDRPVDRTSLTRVQVYLDVTGVREVSLSDLIARPNHTRLTSQALREILVVIIRLDFFNRDASLIRPKIRTQGLHVPATDLRSSPMLLPMRLSHRSKA